MIKKTLIALGLFTSLVGLKGCKEKLDTTKVYPYLITDHYPVESSIIMDTLGHGLFATLVYDLNGLVQNVRKSEIEQSGLTAKQVFEIARINLDTALKSRQININRFDGPDGLPFILFSDHWLSATSILSTNIEDFGKKNLNTDTVYASIPHRDVMLLFPKCQGKILEDFKKMIRDKESDGPKPLTFELFRLDKHKLMKIE